jgi:serine protease Do
MISFVLSSFLALVCADPPPQEPKAPASSPADVVTAIETVISDAIAKAEPSVVAIHRVKGENSQETQAVRGRKTAVNQLEHPQRFGFDGGRVVRFPEPTDANLISFDFGSGVVIGDKGQIVTMYHVVKGARELYVRAADRQQFKAEIIAADPRSDLAVIAPIEGDPAEFPKLKPLAIGDAGKLRKGAFLISLGNSFNAARDGKPSASWGILSNIARKLESPDVDDMMLSRKQLRLRDHPTLLQLDSKLNLGMSGGAVINLKGELVGLTTMAASPAGFDAMAGYAVPMDKLGRRAVETLKEGKEIEYGLLGITPDGPTNRVRDFSANSPAAQGGQILAQDEIIAVNDAPVVDFDSLILAVNGYSAGDAVRLKIRRGAKTIDATIVLAKYPVEGEVIVTNRPQLWRGLRVDYASTVNLRNFARDSFDPPQPGVVVTEVEEGSRAAAAGIKKGQMIHKVEDKSLRSPRDFNDAVAKLEGPVTLQTDLGPVTVK